MEGSRRLGSGRLLVLALGLVFVPVSSGAIRLPAVSSGTLVAQFQVNNWTVGRDGSGNVTSWAAMNDPAIALTVFGSDPANIRFDPDDMSGQATLVVNDFFDDDQVLRGAIPGTRTAATVFWLGFYSPGRDGSLGDGSGQYVYSYAADGDDGSQLDHQIDSDFIELWSGGPAQSGDDISPLDGVYTVWRTVYGDGAGADHSAFANGVNLNMATPNSAAYSASGSLQIFGYQNSSGTSGGFNFVGNISELVIYDGILSAEDIEAVETYLEQRALPEPSSPHLLGAGVLGVLVLGRINAIRHTIRERPSPQ